MASIIKNSNLFCTCCGGTFKVEYPASVDVFAKQTKAFTDLHEHCKQTYIEPTVDHDKSIKEKAMFWMNNGHTGMSSKTMWNCLMGNKNFPVDIPWDPSDFGRCHGLILTVPEWKKRLGEVAKLSDQWFRIIENWDKLVEYLEDQRKTGKANGMYEFMETLTR